MPIPEELTTLAKKEKDPAIIEQARSLNHVPWCDQYERCISGMLYDPSAKELKESRFRAKRLYHRYNTYFPDDVTVEGLAEGRERIIRDIVGHVGKEPWIEAPVYFDYGCNTSIGDNFYANFNLVILDCGLVTIGDRVMMGPGVQIYGATHDVEVAPRRLGFEYAKGVSIGDDCWIGGNVVINAGVSIGRGTTVGAGSVVTRDLPPWSVAVGCPARVVKTVEPVPDMPKKEDEGT